MKAACKFFGKCSGCSLQQFPYVKQLHDKTRMVRREFQCFIQNPEQVETVIRHTVASPEPMGYRISSKLCLHADEMGRESIGLYQQKSKTVLDIPNCPVHHPEIDKIIRKMFRQKIQKPAPFYNHNRKGFQVGRLKFVTVRFNPQSQAYGIVVSHTGVERSLLLAWAEYFRHLNISFYESLLQREDADLVLSRTVKHLAGPKFFRFELDNRSFMLDPLAFFQANGSLAPEFIRNIVEGLQGNYLLDLYGGFGSYAFAAASAFKQVHLVEVNQHAVRAAQETASALGWQTLKTSSLSVEEFMQGFVKHPDASKIDVVIVNPPRSGLSLSASKLLSSEALTALRQLNYVSCNWETLRRDLKFLITNGRFRLISLTPFDMFPQTEHIELVAKLERVIPQQISKKTRSHSILAAEKKSKPFAYAGLAKYQLTPRTPI